MWLSKLFILSTFVFSYQIIISSATKVAENIAISCGVSTNSPAPDGRIWVGDASFNPSLLQLRGKSIKSRAPHQAGMLDPVPYKSARTSRYEFTFQFSVKPGQKFIRLHFKPASYKGFKKSNAIFTVKSGQYTLLSDFSPDLAAGAMGANYFKKEFCINVQETGALSITFIPSRKPSFSKDAYAYVNAIEIVSMPAGLYFTPDGDPGARVVGRKHRFYIDNNMALEMIHRINVGENSISSLEDETMFRDWEDDSTYLAEVGAFSINRAITIRYASSENHVAPKKVYQTARSVGTRCLSDACNLTWNIPLDSGFRYLVRLHFCEIEPGITDEGERKFSIVINNQKAEDEADVIKWSGGHGIPVYRDYITIMEGDRREGKHNLSVLLQSKFDSTGEHTYAILNGIEVFKLSNPDNNLGSGSPTRPVTSSTPETSDKSVSFAKKHKIATVLTFTITLMNIAVYYIRCISESNSGKTNNGQSSGEHQCRVFTLDEMLRSTNNFDPQLLIGSGGYGKVYKGEVDCGLTTVAVKRLKAESRQGENEFWTEIKMLSTLRHKNLLSLIGYCNEGQEMILVYDYMPRGSLYDHLYKTVRSSQDNSSLSWERRIKISIGAARGLDFLHTSQNRVIHRDIKSSNILLDENWVSKISDFGLSKMGPGNESATHVSTQVKGTFGYLDPEYFMTRRLTWATDVFAFGVVLFEVLSGRKAVDERLPEEQLGLVAWAKECITRGEVNKLIDRSLAGSISSTCLEAFVGIAAKCLDDRPHERPTMTEVVKNLEFALVSQKNEGITSLNGTLTSQSKVDTEKVSIEEGRNHMDIEKRSSSSKKKVKSKDKNDIASVRWWNFTSLNGTLTSQSKVDTEKASIEEGRNHTDIEKRSSSSRKKVKSKDKSDIASLRWWNFLGLFPKPLPKSEVSPAQPCAQPEGLHHFSIRGILGATNDFQSIPKVGHLGGDSAYFCFINGRSVVIRRSQTAESRHHMAGELQAKREMRSLPSHVNIVSLIGFGRNDTEMVLVYDFAARGTLHDYLRDPDKDPLPWKQRLEICIGAAEGLNYLRSILEMTTLHSIFNSTYIFLDENLVAKVSEVSWSKTKGNNKAGATEKGRYLDSDYFRDERSTEKSYVYSFGLVLFEMLCAKEALDNWVNQGQVSLAQWIKTCSISQWIDPYLDGKISPECFEMFVDTANNCLHENGNNRPSMSGLITSLQEALKLQEAAESI